MASFAGTPDPRTRELVEALTRHLHAFLRETRLTEDEWWRAIEFLTAVGHLTDDRRQEFILLSDVLGASMQTITINNEAYANATEATVFGPFFVEGSPDVGLGGDISGDAAGRAVLGRGHRPGHLRLTRGRRAGRGLGGRRRRAVRRAVRRRPGRRARSSPHRCRRPLLLLGGHPHAVPDPRRRSRRRAPAGHRPLPDARLPPPPDGRRRRLPHARHPRLPARRRLPRRRQCLRRPRLARRRRRPPAARVRRLRTAASVAGPWSRIDFDLVLAPATT